MSSPRLSNNPHHEDNSFSSLHDHADLQSLLQEIDISVPIHDPNPLNQMDPDPPAFVFEPENLAMVENFSKEHAGSDGGKTNLKATERNRRIKHSQAKMTLLKHTSTSDQPSSSVLKKEHHNAKERVRRLQLNASFLALRSLLPDARRSKKRWSSPRIIDRVLEHIPELENEIENLTVKKKNMLSCIQSKQTITNQNDNNDQSSELQVPTVSVTDRVGKDGAIVQICMPREPGNVLSNLMQKLEGEGMGVTSASSLCVCDDRICYHLHIQVNESIDRDDRNAHLKDKENIRVARNDSTMKGRKKEKGGEEDKCNKRAKLANPWKMNDDCKH